jgi:acetyltransferase-like isoleucine patch superfamily enzyme
MDKNSFFDEKSLSELGFSSVGKNVLISKFARFYDIQNISIGNNVRIDDFCILSGNIKIGNYIHISAYCALYGSKGIVINDFSGLSPKTTIFSASDDFSGDFLIGPMIDKEFTNVTGGPVEIDKYVQIGANSIVFPNVKIGEGVSVGSLSLISKTLDPWGIYAGIPARFIKDRSKKMLELEKKFKQ